MLVNFEYVHTILDLQLKASRYMILYLMNMILCYVVDAMFTSQTICNAFSHRIMTKLDLLDLEF